ncbi:hypothetical protein DVS28_b0289 (plasmid) [Euzebya pacifica]|uniref:Uncharacterized protein n=1 Tax=Euzebya pacifica TaxID=1608957 RepID=A0A346Y6G2_9ACTN|nr:hypothetical protein [Euzebya pacifica]AXV10059.1 hypothetical protein DVS28_b0289 [Euzebya pacifica]
MSFHRENIAWQSKDGTWNLGFFEVVWEGSEEDGEDPEWDVDYDMSAFEWVTTGHPTQMAARRAWNGSNPGSSMTCRHTPGTAQQCDRYDRMAADLRARRRESRNTLPATGFVRW